MTARECGPVPWGYSLISTVRYGLWRLIRLGLFSYNLIETGSKDDGVLTRVFLSSAVKPLYPEETPTAIAGRGDIN